MVRPPIVVEVTTEEFVIADGFLKGATDYNREVAAILFKKIISALDKAKKEERAGITLRLKKSKIKMEFP